MTHDDIIRMAREAGLKFPSETELSPQEKKFAELVIAAEREACAQVCEAEAEKWEGKDGPVCFEARLCSHAIRARGKK